MLSLPALAVHCSVPFALAILLDEGAKWRGAFAAFYVACLVGIGFASADAATLATFAEALAHSAEADLAF